MATTSVPAPPAAGPTGGRDRPARRLRLLTRQDRVVLALMLGVPAILVLGIVWLPALGTVLLSFTNWNGIGPVSEIEFIGARNYTDVVTTYPPFDTAIRNNILFLVVLFLVATPLGMFMAVLLDRELRGTTFYRSALYIPVVLSLALVGFIWQLIYSRDQGLLNAVLGLQGPDAIAWYGDPNVNIWAILVASSWRHVGYIMLLYLAGLRGVDPSLKEAAAVDGAGQARTFFSVVFPVLRPVNIVVLVITVIEALRAFDIAWVVNKGRNGLELLGTLVASNLIGEASLVGFGSAIATLLLAVSTVFIVIYLVTILRGEEQR
jgi:multiple sugar transport system permease protein